jgi:hypothetical protein
MANKLDIELIPKSSWYKNVRSEVSKEEWDKIRKYVYKRANYTCEICGGKGNKWPVECHEIWKFNDDENIQELIGFIALCPDCHMVKHIGLANAQGKGREALTHLAEVNGWSGDDAMDYVHYKFLEWTERGENLWTIDISFIDTLRDIGII